MRPEDQAQGAQRPGGHTLPLLMPQILLRLETGENRVTVQPRHLTFLFLSHFEGDFISLLHFSCSFGYVFSFLRNVSTEEFSCSLRCDFTTKKTLCHKNNAH